VVRGHQGVGLVGFEEGSGMLVPVVAAVAQGDPERCVDEDHP
jgi:hypothetical protein